MNDKSTSHKPTVSRRQLLSATGGSLALAGTIVAANAMAPAPDRAKTIAAAPQAPFDSIRDYLAAMEANGLLVRAGRIDQDKFEGTALMYKLVDRFGVYNAPAILFDEVKINGRWIKGPVLTNLYGHVNTETLMFNLQPVKHDNAATYHQARTYLMNMLEENGGQYPTIPPVVTERAAAPCKEITLEGNEIDIEQFPFFQNNPGDSGRFINTTSVVTSDPEMGVNYGTYRCEIKGPREIIVGTGEGQTGFKMLMAAKERGEKTANIALVCGQDPMTWIVSGSRIPMRRGKKPEDELAYAGGLRGKAIEVVQCDTNDMLVPAQAEMIIEGVVSLEEFKPNGPYGESPGYIGAVYEKAFPMEVTRVTHRKNPVFFNDFTGITKPLVSMPGAALTTTGLRMLIPNIVDYRWRQSVTFISMKKTRPGEALEVGKKLASMIPVFKIVMMVDEDVDVWDTSQLFMAFSTRWQPYPASYFFEDMPAMPLEPSAPNEARSSKIVIDATRQWPEEGGPDRYPKFSRQILDQHDPELFTRVGDKWSELFAKLDC